MMGLVIDQTGALAASDQPTRMLLAPRHVTTRREVLERPSPVPAGPGVYGWYFDIPPADVPVAGTHRTEFGHLLYVGISPGVPPRNGKPPSQQNLRKRIRYHFRGNAAGSTLRLTLGSLLATELGIELRSFSARHWQEILRRADTKMGEGVL